MTDSPQPKLTSLSDIKTWIHESGFTPSKVLGQNFLIDGNILRIMMETGQISSGDRVLEVGPGLGVLTQELVARAKTVLAVEKDKRLAEHLVTRLENPGNLTLIKEDALHIDLQEVKRQHHLNKLLSNLPYSVGSRILVNAFMLEDGFDIIAVTVQLEVAERLAAECGTGDYGLLSIWAQLDYEVTIAKRVSPSCFYPRPTVTSAIVSMKRTRRRRASLSNADFFDALIKNAFSKRRKQIGTILNGFNDPRLIADTKEALVKTGIESSRRPETISATEWIALAEALQA